MGYVYCFHNQVNGKKYIGRTIHLIQRYSNHKHAHKTNRYPNTALYRAFNKYGWDNFVFGIVEECEDDKDREMYWIQYYDTMNNGYNLTLGGEGVIGRRWTESQREAHRKCHVGRVLPPDQVEVIRQNKLNQSQETKDKISYTMTNHHHNLSDWEITFNDGRVLYVTNLKRWCRENGYDQSILSRMRKNNRGTHKDIVGVIKLNTSKDAHRGKQR